MKLNSEISIGNVLTSVSIIIALSTFLYNEVQKRHQIDRAYAAEIRGQLGSVQREVAQMDTELRLLFLSVEPLYVTASEIALDGEQEARTTQIEKARDYLWREISHARAEMERRVLAGSARSSGLAVAGAALQAEYESFIADHASLRLQVFATLSVGTQEALQASAPDAQFSAQIGNALREVHYRVEERAKEASGEIRAQIGASIQTATERFDG